MRWLRLYTISVFLWSSICSATTLPIPAGDPPTIDLPIEFRRARITVRAESGMQSIAKQVADAAPIFLQEISVDLEGLEIPNRIEIRLVRNSRSLPSAAPPGHGAPSWAAGVAYPRYGVVTIAQFSDSEIIDLLSVTSHELAHLALGAALHNQAPRWLDEGFAYLHSSDWSAARTQTLINIAWSGKTIPLRDLDNQFPAQEIEVHKAYAQSYDFVAFLAKRGRYPDTRDDGDRWPFRNFLSLIARGHDINSAALEAYSNGLNGLYQEWYKSLRDRYMLIPSSLIGLFVWCFAAFLLVIGYIRKSRKTKQILARWEEDERAQSTIELS